MGQLPKDAVTLIETARQAEMYTAPVAEHLAYITQTTLSVDDTAEIIAVLRRRFPDIAGPHKEDICYATTNRQEAIKAIARHAGAVFVIGSTNSSNSQRLVEVARRAGAGCTRLIESAHSIDWDELSGVTTVGLSAGASAPESLIDGVVQAFSERYVLTVRESKVTTENVEFKLPRALAS